MNAPVKGELPVEIPNAAPVAVGAAAKAMAYGIEVMSRNLHDAEKVLAADRCVSQYRDKLEVYGWRLVMDRSGERQWVVEPIPSGGPS